MKKTEKIVLAIVTVFVILFSAVPLTYIFMASFVPAYMMPSSLNFPWDKFTSENWLKVLFGIGPWGDQQGYWSIWNYMMNSFLVGLVVVPFCLGVAIPAAYAISRWRGKVTKVYFASVMLFQTFPAIIMIVPLFNIVVALKLLGNIYGLAIIHIAIFTNMAIYLLKGFFDSIPYEIEEAALVDGASKLGVIGRIVMPIMAPGIGVTSIFVFQSSYFEYMFAWLITRGYNKTLPVYIASFIAGQRVFYGEAFAAALVSIIPSIVLFFFIQRYMVRGLATGALKG